MFVTVWFITLCTYFLSTGTQTNDCRRRLYSYTLNSIIIIIIIILFHICDHLCRYSVFIKYGAYVYVLWKYADTYLKCVCCVCKCWLTNTVPSVCRLDKLFLSSSSSLVWSWNLNTAEIRSEIPGKFWNVVLEKDREDELDRSCEKWNTERVRKERNILHTVKRKKVNWIGHILRRNCLLKHVIERKIKGRIEVAGRRARRHKKLLLMWN
jgi:hypothetical protein